MRSVNYIIVMVLILVFVGCKKETPKPEADDKPAVEKPAETPETPKAEEGLPKGDSSEQGVYYDSDMDEIIRPALERYIARNPVSVKETEEFKKILQAIIDAPEGTTLEQALGRKTTVREKMLLAAYVPDFRPAVLRDKDCIPLIFADTVGPAEN